MRAIRVHRKGGPEVLQLEEMPTPRPGAGEALVRVEAAGVNYMDVYTRTGAYGGEMPLTLGAEGAGVVETVGEGVTDVRAGQRVAWASVPGSYATHVVARADKLVPVPDGMSTRDAAAAMLQGMTAHYLAHATFPLKRGDACLVHAAAGGVGLLLVQMAKRAGARVFGTVSTEDKAKLAREAGLDEVVFYTREAFDEVVRARTGGRGLDVVYDSVGATTFDKSLLCLRPRGMMVLYGASSGQVPPLDPQRLNSGGSLYLTRPTMFHYLADEEELRWRSGELFDWIAKGELHVRIGGTYPLADAARAQEDLAARRTTGKLLLLPGL